MRLLCIYKIYTLLHRNIYIEATVILQWLYSDAAPPHCKLIVNFTMILQWHHCTIYSGFTMYSESSVSNPKGV